jgi:hypothetical protein
MAGQWAKGSDACSYGEIIQLNQKNSLILNCAPKKTIKYVFLAQNI